MRVRFFRPTASLILAALLSVGCAERAARPAAAKSDLIFGLSDSSLRAMRVDTVPLGRMRAGETIVKDFSLRNDSDAPIVVLHVETNCNCTDIDYPRRPIKPGESGRCSLTFDSSGLKGWVVKYLYVHTSLGGGTVHKIVLEAEVE